MALEKNIVLANGVDLPNGYVKITKMEFVVGVKAEISVSIYKDKTFSDDKKPPVVEVTHSCNSCHEYFGIDVLNEEGKNMFSQGYLYLKTLSFYANATDVMDVKE